MKKAIVFIISKTTLFETFCLMNEMSVLAELQQWYESQCDGDWEHTYGVKIETLDNPGWAISIDIVETNLEGKPFQEISILEPESDWILCRIEDGKFEGDGSPQKLEEIIKVFLDWTKAIP